jgi:hypothetical protein
LPEVSSRCSQNGSGPAGSDRRGLSFGAKRAYDFALLKDWAPFTVRGRDHADGDARRFAGIQLGRARRPRRGRPRRGRDVAARTHSISGRVVHGRKPGASWDSPGHRATCIIALRPPVSTR